MLQRVKNILPGIFLFILLALMLEFLNFSTGNMNENGSFNQSYKVLEVPLPDTMDFAGEPVPMKHFGVRENLEQEMVVNTYWQSQTLLCLKRANRYFPEIEKILKRNGIPDDFKYLAMAESGFTYKASQAGAVGFWQILKTTAEANGLEVDKDVDERNNLEKSTEAACRYFKEAYHHFHNWTLVAASYNMGMGGVAKSMTFQKQDNYYDLGLNYETARYVYRILALKEIQSNPEKFGFFLKRSDLYPPIPIVQMDVDSSIDNLADYALSLKANYHILKMLNPWLISQKLPNPHNQTYTISLPKTDAAFIDLGENIVYDDTVKRNQCLIDTSSKVQNSCGSKIIVHFVKKGETVETIAKKYEVSPAEVRNWNSLSDSAALTPEEEIILFKDPK